YTESIPATEHSYDDGAVTAAVTCTTAGTRTYTCSSCGSTYQESIPATGHSWDDGVVTAAATHTATGVKTYTCTVCGETKTEAIAKLTFLFDDVQNSDEYYYDAVYWAYDNGITTGTSDTLFSPSDSCTRAQFVTFLWRLAGQPAPTAASCQFTDLDTGEYYYRAVLWAVENGVTTGTTVTTFSPSDKISRAQAVTMLYRYAGSPSVAGLSNSFTDVPSGEYYYNAVLWAVKNGITNGTSTTKFSPGDTCKRAMMVTFLHRFAG
ncbi:MAG: S-layer homology domain-containing protein, partial [Oscillospiraceae bacterium]|nr:S-layer homology domain-containing protein [Oscillospiraceae bacterium]